MGRIGEGGGGHVRGARCDGHLVIWAVSLWNKWMLTVWSPTSLCEVQVSGLVGAIKQKAEQG